jgi:LysR family transcriptional regulator, transcriptional activator of nhaA
MINLTQLRQFWAVAKAGSIQRASENLFLTPQTLSGQISKLEETLGVELFHRVGRRLELTETGRLTLSYADEIFQVAGELEDVLRERPGKLRQLFRVGITDHVPKTLAYRLLAPALQLEDAIHLVCKEDRLTRLLAEIAIHQLDLVITDTPQPLGIDVKCYHHKLGECGITFLAAPEMMRQLKGTFPQCLHGASLLLPSQDSLVRGKLLQWLHKQNIFPHIVGDFDDSALMKAFGQAGVGVFPVPSAVADEVSHQFGVKPVGETDAVKEQFYVISVERRLSHPAVLAVMEAARNNLFR